MDISRQKDLGYIVNIESAVNFDVDFHLDSGDIDHKAFYLEYTYTDDNDGQYEVGRAYRVRLKGIAIRRDISQKNKRLLSQAANELKNIINRSGGFVRYKIDGIDVFNRIIATFYDPVTGECLNNLLLQPKYSSVFRMYQKIS